MHGAAAHDPGRARVDAATATRSSRPTDRWASGRTSVAFRITRPRRRAGHRVRRGATTRTLHLIVVRRDLTGFQHVHPALDADGTWRVPLDLPDRGRLPGVRRLRARPAARPLTLGADLSRRRRLRTRRRCPPAHPTPRSTATPSRLDGDLSAGERVRADARPSAATARRSPTCSPTSARTATWSPCATATSPTCTCTPHGEPGDGDRGRSASRSTPRCPAPGTYRLFLDFQHDGVVAPPTSRVTTAMTGDLTAPAPADVELAIGGMTCASCANRIEKQAQQARRRHRHGQLRHREGQVSFAGGVTTRRPRRRGRDGRATPPTLPARPTPTRGAGDRGRGRGDAARCGSGCSSSRAC